jgi:HEAT repeat protein
MLNAAQKKRLIDFAITFLSISFPLILISSSWAGSETFQPIAGLAQQIKQTDTKKRWQAFNKLSEIVAGNLPDSKAALDVLILGLQEPNPVIRREAVLALRNIGTGAEAAVPALVQRLKQDGDVEVRRKGVRAIQSIDANLALEALIQALDNSDDGVRANVAGALASIGPSTEKAVPKLIELLKTDLNSEVRSAAANALGEIAPRDRTVIAVLNDALKDPAWFVRKEAAVSLEKSGAAAKEAVNNLKKALKEDRNSTMRSWAAAALGSIGSEAKEAIPELLKALDHQNPYVRANAASALGNIGADDETTIKKLIQVLEDEDPGVRSREIEALRQISGDLKTQVENQEISLDKAIQYTNNALQIVKKPELQFKKEDIRGIEVYLQVFNTMKTQQEILEWLSKNQWVWGIFAYLCVSLGVFWLRPLWLLRLDQGLKAFSIKVPVLGGEISLRQLIVGKYHTRVLDAWVSAHIKSVREEFQQKDTVQARVIHIPMTVILGGRTIAQLSNKDLRQAFKKHLLIWGEGGSGKTSLVCQIAQWAMADDQANRISEYQMIPILIEEDLEIKTGTEENPLIAAIRGQLEDLTNQPEPIPEELLEHLLRQRRILVIVDHLSEMSEETRRTIRPERPDFPVNALVITSRLEETLGHVTKTTIKPFRIEGNRLSSFMEAYLLQRGKRDLFTDPEFFAACSRLSLMVGLRNTTALLAKLYAEQLIAAKVGALQELSLQLPDNIPDLMLSYLNELNGHVQEEIKLDDRIVHRDAKVVAWECLKTDYRPTPADREAVLAALGNDAETHLKYLEDRLRLIQTIGVARDKIQFALDPLAEYLAGLRLIDLDGSDREKWLTFLNQADTLSGASGTIAGFMSAVRDCCLAKSRDVKVPEFVINRLDKTQVS